MRIVILVTSNIIKDPRILKQAKTIISNKGELLVVGRKDELANSPEFQELNFNYDLIDSAKDNLSIFGKVVERLKFGYQLYKKTIDFKPNVIHANDFDTLLFAVCAGKKINARIVYDAHEIYSQNGAIAKYKIFSKLIMLVEKYLIKKVDSFITVSNAAKVYYEEKGYTKSPTVITNVPFSSSKISTFKEDKFTVLYQGIISSGRGYEEFLRSSESILPDITMLIRGYGPLKDHLIKEKKERNLQNLKFPEAVPMSDLIYKASEAHVGVVLTKPISGNYKYTVSNKIFEYIHAGIPVILSNVPEHKMLNEKYNFGLILNEVSPKDISNAINYLFKNPEKYNELKDNARKAALELCWEKEEKKLIDLYKRERIE